MVVNNLIPKALFCILDVLFFKLFLNVPLIHDSLVEMQYFTWIAYSRGHPEFLTFNLIASL